MVLRFFITQLNQTYQLKFKGKNMAKVSFKNSNTYHTICEDLEKFLEFCRDYGYKFDEAELYSNKSNSYRNYSKYLVGKQVKNMWEQDGTK